MGFSIHKFKKPSAEFYPGYFWVLNSPMTEENMLAMLHDMKKHKAQSICMHPAPTGWNKNSTAAPDYMSEEYLLLMEKVYTEADRLGMHHYLYDEGGYPSGTALGEVIASDPERFARQYFIPDKEKGGFTFYKEKPGDTPMSVYPNLMEKGVGERFIELSHEKHKKIAGKYFGRSVLYTFTDEPVYPGGFPGTNHMNIGWCSDFGEEFFKRKGYRIEPYFKDLSRKPSRKENETVRTHRIDYCDVCASLFAERYLIPIRDWARKNKLSSGGHFGGDDCPEGNYMAAFGHIMRSLRAMDLPGVDIIWRQIYPRTKENKKEVVILRRKLDQISSGPRNVPFTKYASSIARQSGKNRVLSEDFAVYGAGLTPQVMKYVIDHQLLRGTTNFVFSNIPHGEQGRLLASGCRPKFGPYHPFWDWFDLIHTYTARLASMLSQGSPAVHTLVYYDVPSIWCGGAVMDQAVKEHFRSAEELMKRHIDFDFTDDDALAGSKIINGKLKVGKLLYDTLVLPRGHRMFPSAAKKAAQFRKQGGRVLSTEELDQIAPTLQIQSSSNALRVVKRIKEQETLYFVTNESRQKVKGRLFFPEMGEIHLFEPYTGKRYRIRRNQGEKSLDWQFGPFGSALFVLNPEHEADEEFPIFRPGRKKLVLEENWTIQIRRQCIYEGDSFRIKTLSGPVRKVRIGDWRSVLGEHFSGEVLYRTEFDSPSSEAALLNLGEICYVSEVILNGKSLGRTFAESINFSTEGILKKGKNILEVRVVNTNANAVLDPAVMKYWKEHYPSSMYQEMQYTFEKESLQSGLLGPVTLHFAAKK